MELTLNYDPSDNVQVYSLRISSRDLLIVRKTSNLIEAIPEIGGISASLLSLAILARQIEDAERLEQTQMGESNA